MIAAFPGWFSGIIRYREGEGYCYNIMALVCTARGLVGID